MKNNKSKKSNLIVYHLPTCITCKRALSELERMKIDFEKRDFFKDILTEGEIKKILKLSGLKPKDLIRKRDKMYKELKLENSNKTESQIIKLMVQYPGLIRRPILMAKDKAVIGVVEPTKLK